MELVVDANVLLAAFLKDAFTRGLLLDSRLKLFAPEQLFLETKKHLKTSSSLRKRIHITDQELDQLFFLLTENIETVPQKEFASRMPEALTIAPHSEDAHYLGLALHLSIPIWSNDQGIHTQKKVKAYETKDLLKELQKR